ncbi:maltotransferase domain-containing protein [Corynebacterium frankenforstense]
MTDPADPVARLGLDDIRPTITMGRLPAKAVVGEMVPVFALVWREGHDAVAATLQVTDPDGVTTAYPMVPEPQNPDNHHGVFVPDREGDWWYRVEAWSDPIATWRNAVTKKMGAGQSAEELDNDLRHGAELFERAALKTSDHGARTRLRSAADALASEGHPYDRSLIALDDQTRRILDAEPLRDMIVDSEERPVHVERRKALFSSWYELFPRSTGGWDEAGNPVHGTFATTAAALDRVREMGFDTVYFPPIHPIGEVNRKGRNNTLTPGPEDVGSPWAIGSADGGHDAVHPRLGTLDDFDALVARAEELGLEVALDLALQAAPDHPWAKSHPEFFTVLPDGTIAYAENPPKKYQDIYPLNFDNDPKGIYEEILRVVEFWIGHGVHTFRVDNPHTKPVNFWHWLISSVHEEHPEVIFLAEAFTRPARLYGLSKVGFSQSYTYFTWKTTKRELTEFIEQTLDNADVSRPNLFVNTPDILHESLQYGGRAAFAIRAALAATISPLWGVYSGFELYEHEAVRPGSEEYLDSEKYELRPRDFEGAAARGDSLEPFIALLNWIRGERPALQQLRTLHLHEVDNDQLIAYSKVDPVTGDAVLVVVNLDPRNPQEGTVTVDREVLGLDAEGDFPVHDLVTGSHWRWSDRNFVRLSPQADVAHILALPQVSEERRERLAYREVHDYRP